MHSPSHPSILGRCIHVQVSTSIVQVTLAHLRVCIYIKCLYPQAISRCVYNYNLYPCCAMPISGHSISMQRYPQAISSCQDIIYIYYTHNKITTREQYSSTIQCKHGCSYNNYACKSVITKKANDLHRSSGFFGRSRVTKTEM